MFGKCKVCAEKDKRVADLKDQVESLRKLVHSPVSAGTLPIIDLEANKILEGSDEAIIIEDDPLSPADAALEANAILTGSYQ